jgi:hypothetical protein
LAKFGAPVQGITPEDLIDKGSFFRMGHAPLMVDVLAHVSGVDFESAWNSRVEVEIDPGLKVPVISSEDLIKAKLAAGRDQDILDVAAIREADKQRALGEVANGLEALGGNGQKT